MAMQNQENGKKLKAMQDLGYETDENGKENPSINIGSPRSSRDDFSWETVEEPTNPKLTKRRLFPTVFENKRQKAAEEHKERNSNASTNVIGAMAEIMKNFDKIAIDVQVKIRLNNESE